MLGSCFGSNLLFTARFRFISVLVQTLEFYGSEGMFLVQTNFGFQRLFMLYTINLNRATMSLAILST